MNIKNKRARGAASGKTEDLLVLNKLIEEGMIHSVLNRCYSLEQIPEAHRYVETGQKMGHVVITVDPHNNVRTELSHDLSKLAS